MEARDECEAGRSALVRDRMMIVWLFFYLLCYELHMNSIFGWRGRRSRGRARGREEVEVEEWKEGNNRGDFSCGSCGSDDGDVVLAAAGGCDSLRAFAESECP